MPTPHICYLAYIVHGLLTPCLAEPGRSDLKGVRTNRGEPPLLWLRPLRRELRWSPWTSPSHMCYYVKFGHSASKGVRINKGKPQIGGCLAPPRCGGVWLTPGNTLLPHVCYPAEFGRARSSGASVMHEIPLKNDPLPPSRLSRYSR